MPRLVPAVCLAVPLALALSACGGADSDKKPAAQSKSKETAPAGVAHQHTVLAAEIAARGGKARVGEFNVGYIVEAAEPWFHAEHGKHGKHGKQVHRPPAKDETHHIEIIPMEAKSGRIVPNVPITLEVVNKDGKVVQAKKLNFYYSEFFHYANNFSIPKAGKYTLRAKLDAPTFLRHGGSGEKPALSEGATATFRNVELKPEN
ncbi:iron transporter [Streptomyces sp. NPDC086554]|uniref:iron transporter n=1 Tax=Streptomyces sp. NPDC086554 TaxID=3154864 RepID=UPI00341BC6F5